MSERDVMEESKHAPVTTADYWGRVRRGELPTSLRPRGIRDLAIMIGERLAGLQIALPGHIMTTDDTDPARAHLNGYQDALQDVLEWLTDDDGELRATSSDQATNQTITSTPEVHNHGTEEGLGLSCREQRLPNGQLRGECLLPANQTIEGEYSA